MVIANEKIQNWGGLANSIKDHVGVVIEPHPSFAKLELMAGISAGIKRKSSDEWEAENSLKKRKTDGSEHFTDLAEVIQLLRRHGYFGVSYYDLGLFLGLSSARMGVITKNNRNDAESCLRECLAKWLEKADDVQKKGGPTIYSLLSALRELGENAVADGIDMEMHPACKILSCHSAQNSLVTALPQLVLLLHAAKLIKEMILPTNIQGEALLIKIKEAVCIDYQKLEAFADILCKSTATAKIGNTIMKEYREVYCSDDFIQANDAVGLKIYLPMNVTSQFQSMRLKMGQTFFKVGSIMMNNPQSPTLDNIKYVLGAYDKTLRPQVAQCQDIHSILQLVCDNCQLDDISLLEFFVNEFNIEEAKPVIEEYKEAVEELKEMKLSQYLNKMVSHASPIECEIVTIFVDENVKEFILNDVKILSSAVFGNLSRHVRLNVVKFGNSFTITCSFPLILSEQLITAALNNIDVLKESKVKRLTIGYCTVYEVKDNSTPTTTEIDECTSSLSTSSGLSKQLMLSLSVELINSKEEVTALNEESITMKKEAESLKETLVASIAESKRFKKIAAETSQLLQEKVSLLAEHEEENENLKEIKELLEEQLALFQSEKDEIKQSESGSIVGTIAKHDKGYHQEENEDIPSKEAETTETLQSIHKTIQRRMAFEIESLKRELKQKDNEINEVRAESKKEIELLQEKITTMNLQQIKKDKQMKASPQEKNPLIFQDDIYGGITIDHPLIREIVQTHQFQRLKDIKKL
ncbi:PREDICTED: uncharacterized protein LOC109586326, partial [Amphimedon queenslandica]|uniref:Death domain-containing protein n=2 Tax=Amphimedon queenslandica TaxID=400682 RepID=A0AAN0JMQ9_AMPQE